jgi:beta-xylosidase
MTTTLTARAPAPGTPPRTALRRHSALAMAIGLVVAIAGLLVATRTITDASDHRTTPVPSAAEASPTPHEADASPPDPAPTPAPRPEQAPAPRGEPSETPERLSPQPPADGRDAPDPTVVHHGDVWALFSTQVGLLNIPVAVSNDLRRWSEPVDALPWLPAWAAWGHTWAPGVLRRDNGFVLYFAAPSPALGAQCIGAATAPTIEGPYTSHAPEPLVCQPDLGGSIDPQPFVDRDGTAYLLWKADANAIGETSQLFAQPLRPDGLALTGNPVALLRSHASWEQPLIENPALLAVDGSYLLLYSGGWWKSAGYATGYAVCHTPLGPCDKQTTQQPILAGTGDQAGTGGASVITGPSGDHWLAYHAWRPSAIGYHNGGARSLHFASLSWEAGQLVVAPQG